MPIPEYILNVLIPFKTKTYFDVLMKEIVKELNNEG